MKDPNVLILGINGMTGYAVYRHLKENHENIFGTLRKSGELPLSVDNLSKDFKKIIKKIKRVDYVINCIGLNNVDEKNKAQAIKINSQFPVQLSELSKTYNFKLILISTDAIFNKLSGMVNESTTPSPQDPYGITKLLGESLSNNSIIIRTSLVGLSPHKKKGLIEFVLNTSKEIDGFENQIWSGCTTLQFAKLVESLIYDDQFLKLQKTKILHFAPLGPVSKYDLVKEIIKIYNLKTHVNKINSSVIITRYLSSNIIFDKQLDTFGRDLGIELDKLLRG